MVNPCLPEGQWNTYDFVFEAPAFEQDKVVKRACLTLLFNGVLAHHRVELLGATAALPIAVYKPHAPSSP